jgi:hypothetical protein
VPTATRAARPRATSPASDAPSKASGRYCATAISPRGEEPAAKSAGPLATSGARRWTEGKRSVSRSARPRRSDPPQTPVERRRPRAFSPDASGGGRTLRPGPHRPGDRRPAGDLTEEGGVACRADPDQVGGQVSGRGRGVGRAAGVGTAEDSDTALPAVRPRPKM